MDRRRRHGRAPATPVTIDVYEDFLCPFCERFETRNGNALTAALNEGKVKVNYHSLNILDARTTPPGYSTLAANAALCAVPAGIWPAFHARLFAEQPAEGSAGLTAAQLSAIGTSLGAGPAFTQCVEGNGNAAAITAATGRRLGESGAADGRPVRDPDDRRRRPEDRRLGLRLAADGPRSGLTTRPPVRGTGPGRVPSSSQGAVAQLVAHLTGSQRVRGSSPLSSTHSHQRGRSVHDRLIVV